MHHESGSPANQVRPLLRVRQVRQFTDEPVDADAIEAIADAARWSGSSRNSQPWRFVIVREAAVLRSIAEAGLPQTRSLATATAAIAIAVPEEQGSAVSHAFDEGRAAERMLIAASFLELGAGIAWVRTDIRPGRDRASRPPRGSIRADHHCARPSNRRGTRAQVRSRRGAAPACRDRLPRAVRRALGVALPGTGLEVRGTRTVHARVDNHHEPQVIVAFAVCVVGATRAGTGRVVVQDHGPPRAIEGARPAIADRVRLASQRQGFR